MASKSPTRRRPPTLRSPIGTVRMEQLYECVPVERAREQVALDEVHLRLPNGT